MDDFKEISTLILKYSSLVNSGESAPLKALFAPGGRFSGLATFDIDTEFEQYQSYLEYLRCDVYPNFRQFISPSLIHVEGASARAETQVMLLYSPVGDDPKILKTGILFDTFTLTYDGWKFVERYAEIDGD